MSRQGIWLLALICCATPAGAQTREWPSERPPRPLPAREVQFPPYEMRMLPNGMQVIAVLHHEQPIVTMRLLVRAGAAQDPKGKTGVATLSASLLDQGTTTRTAEAIADQIDFIGGALNVGAGTDLTFASAMVMKDSFGVGMELLQDVVRNPAFAKEEIDRQKEQAVSSLQVSARDPDYIADSLFDRLVYGFHPYGLPSGGTPESLASITRDDLQTFHRQYFVPNNMILAIVGDITGAEAFSAAERVFGSWPRGDVPATKPTDPPPPTRRIVVVDKPDSVQTEIRVGMLAIPRKHPDYMAWDLAVKILGGEGANRLHRVLRSERGLTYGAEADTAARKQAGDFVAQTDTRTETTGEALRLMIDEFAKLARDRVGERELADAEAYLEGAFPLTIETPNQIATQILNVLAYDLPIEEIPTFRERVAAVTPDDVQRVARAYIKTDRLSIVLVGNARFFLPQLTASGFTGVEVIPVDQLDLMSASLKREMRAGTAPALRAPAARASGRPAYQPASAESTQTPAPEMTADALVQLIVRVKGGIDALRAVRTVVADAATTFRMEQGTLASTTRTYVSYPDRFRVDATINEAQVVQVYNAGAAWVKDPSGVHDAPAPMRDDFASSVQRDIIPLLIAAADRTINVRRLPQEGRDGSVLSVVELSGPTLPPVRLYVNSEGLVVRQAYSTPGPDGKPVEAEEVFSEYQVVNGIRVPFKAGLLRNGRPILERTLTKVSINSPVDAALFTRPQER